MILIEGEQNKSLKVDTFQRKTSSHFKRKNQLTNSNVSLGGEKLFSPFAFLSLTLLAAELNLRKPGRVGKTVQAEFLTFAPLPIPFLISPKVFAHQGESVSFAAVYCSCS